MAFELDPATLTTQNAARHFRGAEFGEYRQFPDPEPRPLSSQLATVEGRVPVVTPLRSETIRAGSGAFGGRFRHLPADPDVGKPLIMSFLGGSILQ